MTIAQEPVAAAGRSSRPAGGSGSRLPWLQSFYPFPQPHPPPGSSVSGAGASNTGPGPQAQAGSASLQAREVREDPPQCSLCREFGHLSYLCPLVRSRNSTRRSLFLRQRQQLRPSAAATQTLRRGAPQVPHLRAVTPPSLLQNRVYHCTVCKKRGHNKARCPENPNSVRHAIRSRNCDSDRKLVTREVDRDRSRFTIPSQEKGSRAPPRCSICRMVGHTRPTCPLRRPPVRWMNLGIMFPPSTLRESCFPCRPP